MTQPTSTPARVVALLSPGAMGSAVGARLVARGATVLTSLAGRGAASAERAGSAGMIDVGDADLARADLILSILPPAEAAGLAQRLLPHFAADGPRPLYIDANALSPESKRGIADMLAGAGVAMVDGGIVGPPPRDGGREPTIYLSGPDAERGRMLADLGLRIAVLDGPVGAAAALKMCYAAMNKGVVALAVGALLAAERAGAGDALAEEMAASMPDLLARFRRQVPDMYPKAYRWVAEMHEIAAFLGEDAGAAAMFDGAADLFDRIAADMAGDRRDIAALDRILAR
ncbi:MAG: Phosphogluconate dehydrogenase, NAD-binding, putative-like protein [Sphingomonas bacterium]|jgi:putative dehydrogenase|nr:NAD(P)-dependent oxidoreductase [Sphingomonas bacterium]MDB5689692.1 Phosphogluconate dehydrogenase, NAD-binding, putative-like protein [Sphingomonas bacterium]